MKPRDGRLVEALFVAEQTLLLVRLAADTGARRGELAVLRLSDLDGRVLSIERNLSLEVLGPTKTSRKPTPHPGRHHGQDHRRPLRHVAGTGRPGGRGGGLGVRARLQAED